METQTYNGVTYQRSGPGQPWQRVGASAPSQGTYIPPSARTERRKDAEADRASAEAQKAIAEARTAADRVRAELIRAQADAEKATADATRTNAETAALPTPATPEVKAARNVLATDSIIDKISTARRQINDGWSTGNFAGDEFFQGIPWVGQNSADLAATLEGITGSLINDTLKEFRAQSATGASGFGSLTEREAQRLAAAVASVRQTQSPDALRASLATIEKHYRNLMALKNNEDPTNPDVAAKYGIALDRPDRKGVVDMDGPGEMGALPTSGGGAPPADPGQAMLSSEGQYVDDPALAGVNATVARMYREGRSADDVRAYLNRIRPGLGDGQLGIEAAVAYARQNPGADLPVDLERVWQPSSGLMQGLGDAALWEDPLLGFSPGAAVIGAGDMFSFGTLDNLSSNPDMARAVMTGVEARNPGSFLTGQVAGGVTNALGLETALARGGLGAIGRARVGDLALGAGYGAGSADDGGRGQGAIEGGLFGLAGGAAGRRGARIIGRGVAGVADPARRYLAERGVPQTVGQILGGGVQRVEDRLAGLPFIGDQILARRREGVEAFNRAAFDEALAPIRATTGDMVAEAGIDRAQDMVGDAYRNALGGVNVTADPDFVQGLSQSINGLRNVPRVGDEVVNTLDDMIPPYFGPGGTLSGDNMQPLLRGLGQVRQAYRTDPLAHRVGEGIEGVEGAVEGMFARQAPEVMTAYRSANEAFRNEEVLRAAVNASRNGARSNQPGLFMPSQLADAAAANSRRFGNSAGTTRQPFYELSRAGQEVLPSQIPDSGTAGRLVLPAAAFTLGGGGGYAAEDGTVSERAGTGASVGTVAALLAAAPYSAGARNAVARSLLADRNPTVRRIGEEIIERNRVAGLLASAPLVAATQGQ